MYLLIFAFCPCLQLLEDKALKTLQKKTKTHKNPKDDEWAEPREFAAQLGTTEHNPSPAAPMSTLHLPQTAAEVSTSRSQSIPELTLTSSTARELRSAQKLSPDAFVPEIQGECQSGKVAANPFGLPAAVSRVDIQLGEGCAEEDIIDKIRQLNHLAEQESRIDADLQMIGNTLEHLAKLKANHERHNGLKQMLKQAEEEWGNTLKEAESFWGLRTKDQYGRTTATRHIDRKSLPQMTLKGGMPQQTTASADGNQFGKDIAEPYGLVNLGNTCYMNVIIQSLQACSTFRDVLLKRFRSSNTERIHKYNIASEFANVLRKQLTSVTSPLKLFNSICAIPSCLPYANKKQQDCCELLNRMMDHWSDVKATEITDLFTGHTKSELTCSECSHRSHSWEPFTMLQIGLDTHCASLEDLLARRQRPETLDGSNKCYCVTCRKDTVKYKRISISSTPPILAIQLKRFKQTEDNNGIKLTSHVPFKENLEIETESIQNVSERIPYKLRAVISHCGKTISNGHYIAVTRQAGHSAWFRYSDQNRARQSKIQLLNQQAYLLIYERTSPFELKQDEVNRVEQDDTLHTDQLLSELNT